MQVFQDKEFHRGTFADRDSAAVYEGFDFNRCCFQSYFLSLTSNPALRSTIRNVRLHECSQRGCTLYAAIVEDVLVDGLNTNGQLVRAHGAVFNRVVLRGKIDRLMLNDTLLPSSLAAEAARQREIALFQQANMEFYRRVDWALDISGGEFVELDIGGIPGRLIRRDPETQVLVKHDRVLQEDWRNLDFNAPITSFVLDEMLKRNTPDKVLIAPKRHPKFRDYLSDLQLLRRAGVAEPE